MSDGKMTNEIVVVQPQDTYSTLMSNLSDSSRGQYLQIAKDWRDFCDQNDIDPFDLRIQNISAYLHSHSWSRNTMLGALAKLRKMVWAFYAANPSDPHMQACYEQIKAFRLPTKMKSEGSKPHRAGRKLTTEEIQALFDAYDPTTNRGARNRAMLAIMFFTGLRRSEVVALKWENIKDNHIEVVGGKARESDHVDLVPIIYDELKMHLRTWYAKAPGRVWLIPRMYKGDTIGPDKPMTDDGLYFNVTKDFAPHDARRTLITELLDQGVAIHDAKQVARHKDISTTGRYAVKKDVEALGDIIRRKLK